MVNYYTHKEVLISILKDIYADRDLRTVLGFKGGTAAFLFYQLPRLSVDLDFDLLDEYEKEAVLTKIPTILPVHGHIREARKKRHTLFFLLSYGAGERTVKIEISKRKSGSAFEMKRYLGIPMLVMEKPDMIANKLAALITRSRFAMRDVYDVWFFLKEQWEINETVFVEQTGMPLKKGLEQAITLVSNLSKNEVLRGLGELLDEKQKIWAKEHLVEDTIFYLRLYHENKNLQG